MTAQLSMGCGAGETWEVEERLDNAAEATLEEKEEEALSLVAVEDVALVSQHPQKAQLLTPLLPGVAPTECVPQKSFRVYK